MCDASAVKRLKRFFKVCGRKYLCLQNALGYYASIVIGSRPPDSDKKLLTNHQPTRSQLPVYNTGRPPVAPSTSGEERAQCSRNKISYNTSVLCAIVEGFSVLSFL
jgi:hypothetical protein